MILHWSASRGGSYLQSQTWSQRTTRGGQGATEGWKDKGQERREGARERPFAPHHAVSENVPPATPEGRRRTNRRDMRDSLLLLFPSITSSHTNDDDKPGLGCYNATPPVSQTSSCRAAKVVAPLLWCKALCNTFTSQCCEHIQALMLTEAN